METVFGALGLGSSAGFVVLAVVAAARAKHGRSARSWPWLFGLAVVSGVSALAVSQIDPEADEPFCYAWAVVAAAAAALSSVGWLRRERVTGTVLGLAFLVLWVTSRLAGSGFDATS